MDKLDLANPSGDVKHRYKEVLSQLCLVSQLNEAVSLIGNLPELCISIVNAIIDFTPAENCSIMLIDPETASLNLVVAKGRDDRGSFFGTNDLPTTVFARGEGAAGWAAENDRVLSIEDCETDQRFVKLDSAAKEVNSVICAPISTGGSVMGVINCSHSKKRSFSDTDKQNVALVADHCAVMLEKALALDKQKNEKSRLEKNVNDNATRLSEAQRALADLKEQLLRSERFATLGEMLASVAHELNNRIAPILVYSQMLRQQAANEKDEKRLRVIEESAMGAKAILETFLNYSRPDSKEKTPANLNQILQKTLTLTEYKLRNHGINVSLDLSPDLPLTTVNEKQIAQVFLNIVNNAVHAMEHTGGELRIRSSHDGNCVRFSVSDTGPGVPPELKERIFEPFFTTKDAGKGTGLGLSISRRYLEEHNGRVCLDDTQTPGAHFIIEIPRTDCRDASDDASAGGPPEGAAKILVVDDDSTIRDVIRDILGPGYSIQFAADGNDATNKLERDAFDLLVIDYHMPGFDGKQLYEWVVRNRPSLQNRIIFSTGDIYHREIREFFESTGCHCLIKPFSTSDLREIVSVALAA